MTLNPILVNQYEVENEDLKHLLLSPRAKFSNDTGYTCCNSCYTSLCGAKKKEVKSPPKKAIANGFAIGHVPNILTIVDESGVEHTMTINPEEDLSDLLCSAISPVRSFGYIQAWSGGSQKSITGHFSLFSVDEVDLVDFFPNQFPFGCGGPKEDRKTNISESSCIEHYMKLSLNQFMRPDFVLVSHQLLSRSLSYKSGLIKC